MSKTFPAKTALVAALALTVASGAFGATGWRVVKSGASSGQLGIQSINIEMYHPKSKGMAVRLVGKVQTGASVVSCSKGHGVASWSRSYRSAGTYVLPQTIGAEHCTVVASVGGSGKVVVQILRRY